MHSLIVAAAVVLLCFGGKAIADHETATPVAKHDAQGIVVDYGTWSDTSEFFEKVRDAVDRKMISRPRWCTKRFGPPSAHCKQMAKKKRKKKG
jgi:hypothetical protein